jgi:hypothetical protein
MGLFDSLNLSVQTPAGTFALAGGKLNVGGFAPEAPQPTRLTPAGAGTRAQIGAPSAMDWIKANPLAVAGIAAGALALAVVILRR